MKFAILSLGTFCSLTPGSFGSFNLGSLVENSEQSMVCVAVPGEEVGRRRGESGGKQRGARELPLGGRGRSGGGRGWALHGEGRTTVGLGGGGASPATLGG